MTMDALQILAAGARTPVGPTAEGVAAAVRTGISRVQLGRSPVWGQEGARTDAGSGPDWFFAMDPLLDRGDASATSRIAALGRAALGELVAKLGRALPRTNLDVPVLVGLPEERPGWSPADLAGVSAALAAVEGAAGLRLRIELRPHGHAAAIEALHDAQQRLPPDGPGMIILGGVDSYHDPETLAWLRENRQWLGEGTRTGFAPGEAAAFVMVMRASEARRLGLSPGPTVLSVATAIESKRINSDDICLGEGLTAAVSNAIAGLGSGRHLIDDVRCDINGERYRSEEWGFVALRLGAALRDATDYKTPVQSCGDVGAASGALNLAISLQAWRRRYARGPRALVWGSSEGGLRAAAVLAETKEAR